jgi:hypothetical protein
MNELQWLLFFAVDGSLMNCINSKQEIETQGRNIALCLINKHSRPQTVTLEDDMSKKRTDGHRNTACQPEYKFCKMYLLVNRIPFLTLDNPIGSKTCF